MNLATGSLGLPKDGASGAFEIAAFGFGNPLCDDYPLCDDLYSGLTLKLSYCSAVTYIAPVF
jgi:hypothetical protein